MVLQLRVMWGILSKSSLGTALGIGSPRADKAVLSVVTGIDGIPCDG